MLPLLLRILSYSRLIRVTAWILRYIYNLRHPQRRQEALSTKELNIVETHWLKELQHWVFQKRMEILRNNKRLPSTSKLVSVPLFVDSEGLLRVGGRLEHGKFAYAKRHPVLLPGDHKVVELASYRVRACTITTRRAYHSISFP